MRRFLIVIDMQNDFVAEGGSLLTPGAHAICEPIAEYMRNFNGEVICTYDTHYNNYLNTREGKNLPIKHCIQNTWGWKLVDSVDKAAIERNAIVYYKQIFGDVVLANDIYEVQGSNEDIEIEICGVCTDICVISNALLIRSFAPEAKITVLKDLCAGTTQAAHEAALKVMESCQIEVK